MLKQFVKFNDILHFCYSSFNSITAKFLLLFFFFCFFFFLFVCLFSFSFLHFLRSQKKFFTLYAIVVLVFLLTISVMQNVQFEMIVMNMCKLIVLHFEVVVIVVVVVVVRVAAI